MLPRAWALLSLAVLATACDPSGSVGAIVVDPSGAAVADASVGLSCDNHGFGDGALVKTDASGKFYYSKIPDIDERCILTVEKAGFLPRRLTRKQVAYSSGVKLDEPLPKIRLEPEAPK